MVDGKLISLIVKAGLEITGLKWAKNLDYNIYKPEEMKKKEESVNSAIKKLITYIKEEY